jgi:hypothetical protein
MPLHNVPESDNFSANVQMPADGDAADASDFEASTIKPIVDRVRWLYNRIVGSTATSVITDAVGWVNNLRIPSTAELPTPNAFSRLAQDVGDRTAYLRSRLNRTGGFRARLSGTSVAPETRFTVSEEVSFWSSSPPFFSVSSNDIFVPATGPYLVSVMIMISTGSVGSQVYGVGLYLNGIAQNRNIAFLGPDALHLLNFTDIIEVTNIDHPISIRAEQNAMTIFSAGSIESRVTILKVGSPA